MISSRLFRYPREQEFSSFATGYLDRVQPEFAFVSMMPVFAKYFLLYHIIPAYPFIPFSYAMCLSFKAGYPLLCFQLLLVNLPVSRSGLGWLGRNVNTLIDIIFA